MMRQVGLIPSETGKPGGKETGQAVLDYIEEGGRFQRVCQQMLATGFVIPWHTIVEDHETAHKKRASKTRYTCSSCGLNAWAKPDVRILCVECQYELAASL